MIDFGLNKYEESHFEEIIRFRFGVGVPMALLVLVVRAMGCRRVLCHRRCGGLLVARVVLGLSAEIFVSFKGLLHIFISEKEQILLLVFVLAGLRYLVTIVIAA